MKACVLPGVLYAFSFFAQSTAAHPFDLPFKLTDEHDDFLQKRGSFISITGAPGTAIHPRYEIRTMRNEKPNQFTLFILAMQQFQAQAQTQSTSYSQIAGIHGVPRASWNNVQECADCRNVDGYCTHVSVLFPAWHRAYLALFEQELLSIVISIANSWPTSGAATTRTQMQAAASTFRFPFWDWAAEAPDGQHVFTDAFTSPTLTINGPKGLEFIANPLFSYKFQTDSNMFYYPFTNWENTIRYPTNDSANAVTQEDLAVSAFDNIQPSLRDQVYQLMTACTDYIHFSNANGGSSTTSCHNSLEGIHNTVHQTAGGPGNKTVPEGGHMTYLAVAAFDPIFWLHHANVDRLFALWQTLHPQSYGASQVAVQSTWTIASGSTQDANSPLKPFTKNTNGEFWTTNDVKDWSSTFHYTYPEFVDSKGDQAAIASYVNKLYASTAAATAGSTKRTAAPNPVQAADVIPTSLSKAFPTLLPKPSSGIPNSANTSGSPQLTSAFQSPNGSNFQYVANVKTPKNALAGSYFVYLFDGPPSIDEPSKYLFAPNLIGPVGVLSQNTMASDQTIVTGSVPLTRTMQQAVHNGDLADLSPFHATPWLTKNLQWRIVGPKGDDIDPSTLSGFQVSVYSSTSSSLASEFDLPQWSEFIPLHQVTRNKPGGLGALLSHLGEIEHWSTTDSTTSNVEAQMTVTSSAPGIPTYCS